MNTKVREHLLSIVLLITFLLGGCAPAGTPPIMPGDAIALQQGATQYGLNQALSGAQPVAKALSDGKDAIVSWPGPGQCWSCIVFSRSAGANGAQAQAMNANDMSDLMRWLVSVLGWTKIAPTQLTPVIMPVTPGMLDEFEEPQS